MAFIDYDLQEKLKGLGSAEYDRRSTVDGEDKQIRSIEGQHLDIQEQIINKFNLKNVKRYQESQSAFKVGRPQFYLLIDDIENGLIQVVLVWHPNRISRNYADGGRFVQLMSESKLHYVITPNGIFENTPRDKEYLMNEFTRATRDSDDKSEVVKRGNRTKLKDGYIPSGRLSEGYRHVKNQKEEMINDSDPDRFPLLKKAIELVLNQTHTPMEALAVLNEKWGYRTKKTKRTGGNPLSKSTWYKILSDPKYYGLIVRAEGEFAAEFPKLLDKEEFDKLQIILGKGANRNRVKNSWPYTGEITCGDCGGFITMEEKWQIICPVCKTKFHISADRSFCPNCETPIEQMRNPTILHYIWLHCTKRLLGDGSKCKQPSIAVIDFEGQVHKLIEQLTIPEGFSKWAIKWLQGVHAKEVEDRTNINDSLQKLHNDVQTQIDKLLDLRLKGLVDDAEYEKKKEVLLLEKKEVTNKLKTTDKRADDWLDLCERTFNFATYAHAWFIHGDNEQKRGILKALGSNLTLENKILSIRQRKPFMILNGMKEKYGILLETIEQNDTLDTIAQKAGSPDVIPSLLRD